MTNNARTKMGKEFYRKETDPSVVSDVSLNWMRENSGKMIKITPALAKAMLKHNTQNRALSQATVNRYAALIKDGEWAKSSDMISFDSDGTLTNGQHRLEAVVKSGCSIESVIWMGIPHSVYTDRGKTRSIAEVLDIAEGSPHNPNVVSAISLMYRLYGVQATASKIPEGKAQMAYKLLEEKIDVIPTLYANKNKAFSYGADYIAAVLMLLFSDEFNDDQVKTMHERLMSGVLQFSNPGDLLLKTLRDNSMKKAGSFSRRQSGADHSVIGPKNRCKEYLRYMIPYLKGRTRKAKEETVTKFIEETLDRLFGQANNMIRVKNNMM